jgi:hypothetical protein
MFLSSSPPPPPRAQTLLSLRRSHERLEHCWGVNSTFSLPELKAATLTALKVRGKGSAAAPRGGDA